MKVLQTIDRTLGKIFRFVSSASFTIVLLLFLYTIFLRWFKPIIPILPVIPAGSEIAEMCLVWGVFIASAELCRTNQQIVVDIVIEQLNGKMIGKLLMILTNILSLTFGTWVTIGAYRLISRTSLMMVYLPFSKGLCYACIPICSMVMVIYSLKNIIAISGGLFSNKA